jgi:hypothetical protein
LSKYETEAGVDFKKFYQERDEFLKNNTLSWQDMDFNPKEW